MGVALVPDAGLAPGLCNAVAADAIARLEKIDSVRLYAGALPERNIPRWDTKESRIWRAFWPNTLGYPTF
jgi:saccharopine dehydrogenase-like NADP-dependent oxidoreductase